MSLFIINQDNPTATYIVADTFAEAEETFLTYNPEVFIISIHYVSDNVYVADEKE